MLTVASPRADRVLLTQRAQSVRTAIERLRSQSKDEDRASLIIGLPTNVPARRVQAAQDELTRYVKAVGLAEDVRGFNGTGFFGADLEGHHDDETILAETQKFLRESLPIAGFQPEMWQPVIIRDWRDLKDTEAKLQQSAADKYSYRELDDYTDLIARTLQAIPLVSKVRRAGALKERVFLDYSQDRLAAYGIQTNVLQQLLGARNITTSGGVLEIGDKNLGIKPSGEFKNEQEIGNTIITATAEGAPVYARDLFEITRGYEDPPRYLNYYTARDASGQWQRTRAITLAVSMRKGEQIAEFGKAVDETLAALQLRLPGDLVLARTSDQPLQVKENVGLFTRSLWEAVVLVVMICLIGFREWRSAALVAASIPLTLAMTFGMMRLLGLDIHHGRCNGFRLVPAGVEWRAAVGRPVLRANWRADSGELCDEAVGTGAVCDFRVGFEVDSVGGAGGKASNETGSRRDSCGVAA